MNSTEMLDELEKLTEAPFDAAEFPYAFLEAFDNKPATIARLKKGAVNKTDIADNSVILNAVLQRNNIHIAVCKTGETDAAIKLLAESPATQKYKAKFILATDGINISAEDTRTGDIHACVYKDLPDAFGFFMELAGLSIKTAKDLQDKIFDIKAAGRLNKLYLELLKTNPEWGEAARRHDMNHFMARLIFCFFAEDTDIFLPDLFTKTLEQMSAADSLDTHEIISAIFRSMNIDTRPHNPQGSAEKQKLPRYAHLFPYVNGGLFGGEIEIPKFSKIARSYLLRIGALDWSKINPDIFGSMIQAIADDDERANLGMHYTSVPNILKVLNPLFLDKLREKLEQAGSNKSELTKLRNRIKRIRVFDPACGSGNFLVIAYRELRAIEANINNRYSEPNRKSEISLRNFRGIEINDFPAEIARLALIIAEYQCDVQYLGQKEALAAFLPLDSQNWIICGNALQLDWLSICPANDKAVLHKRIDLLTESDQAEVNFDYEGGETYICGNPPYLGSAWQNAAQKADMKRVFVEKTKIYKALDYVTCWFVKAADYAQAAEQSGTTAESAFVATNSICQGRQVAALWPLIFKTGRKISFAWNSFKWNSLASHKAMVTVSIIGLANKASCVSPLLYEYDENNTLQIHKAENINAYLLPAANIFIEKRSKALSHIAVMRKGNMPNDGGNLLLSPAELKGLGLTETQKQKFVRRIYGSKEFINNKLRYCIWINTEDCAEAYRIPALADRFASVAEARRTSSASTSNPYSFAIKHQKGNEALIIIPEVSSENRDYLPVGSAPKGIIITNKNFGIYNSPLWNMALIASRLHLLWIATVCGKMKTDFSYSNILGWNTFPVPKLTEQEKKDLTRAAKNILLAREAHFPATIAELYAKDKNGKPLMPENLRAAHEVNDDLLEHIYIGRRFKNDTERLEHLFKRYTEMTEAEKQGKLHA